MNHQKFLDTVASKRCIVCQSSFKKTDNSKEFPSTPHVVFECSLDSKHYRMFADSTTFEIEEQVTLMFNNKEHQITQYWDDYHLVITVFENGIYACSKGIDLDSLAFDFLNDDLEKNVSRLKTVLTFQ